MAYGSIAPPRQLTELPTLSFPLPGGWELTTHAISGSSAPNDVLDYLYSVFGAELERACLFLLGTSH
jgi:hypothetical protein